MSAEPIPDEILLVSTTVADEAAGRALARALVQERLAACVQLEPIAASVYRWEGRLHEAPEWRLLIKTDPERQGALALALRRLHPYALPEFVAQRAPASAAYAAWVRSETA